VEHFVDLEAQCEGYGQYSHYYQITCYEDAEAYETSCQPAEGPFEGYYWIAIMVCCHQGG